MSTEATTIEQERLELQAKVDGQKTQTERNKLGQFATPMELAKSIVRYAVDLLPKRGKVRFLDPGFGTGSFYSALLELLQSSRIGNAHGFEVDDAYYEPTQELWKSTPLKLTLGDFASASPPSDNRRKSNLIVCNPPYVRHHHLNGADKIRLQQATERSCGIHLNGLSGLYCYFLLISHAWMAKNGVAAWLIPSEFMDVIYGRRVKAYLLSKVTLLRVHRFEPDDVQFADALVSSAVLFFRNATPSKSHEVEFTYGGSLERPKNKSMIPADVLHHEAKWTRFPMNGAMSRRAHVTIGDLFNIKRGLATGNNKFFIVTPEQAKEHKLPRKFLRPILPSPRMLKTDEIKATKSGEPLIENRLYLVDCDLEPDDVHEKYPQLWAYLQSGIEAGVTDGYLCRHRQPWYMQEKRPASYFLCTYMGRQAKSRDAKPFRLILNHSQATAANVYLILYPKPDVASAIKDDPSLLRMIWKHLSQLCPKAMISEGRVYGGGLHKLEPKELANVPADAVAKLVGASRLRALCSTVLSVRRLTTTTVVHRMTLSNVWKSYKEKTVISLVNKILEEQAKRIAKHLEARLQAAKALQRKDMLHRLTLISCQGWGYRPTVASIWDVQAWERVQQSQSGTALTVLGECLPVGF